MLKLCYQHCDKIKKYNVKNVRPREQASEEEKQNSIFFSLIKHETGINR